MPTKKKGKCGKPAASTTGGPAFTATFLALKAVLATVLSELQVSHDEPRKYYLVTRSKSWRGGPMFFGGVIMGKAYVSYHLMPLYTHPELVKAVSPELRKRMQGKACFNFKEPNERLFAELTDLSKSGLEKYRSKKWL